MKIFTALDIVEATAIKYPAKIAIKDEIAEISFLELVNKSMLVGRYLVNSGISKGDRIGVFKRNSIKSVISFFGIMYAGAAFVCINTKLKPRQVNHIIDDCGISKIISNHHGINYFFNNVKNKNAEVVDIDEILSASNENIGVSLPNVIDKDLSMLIYTSGSTGKAKGVMFSHNEVVMCSKIMVELFNNTSEDNALCTLPFSADYGLTLLYTMLLSGGKLTILDSFFPNDIVNELLTEKITGYSGITPIWSLLFGSRSLLPEKDFPNLRYITIGGGYPPKPIMKQIMEKFEGKTDIYMLYGLTEASWSTCLMPGKLQKKYGSIGTPIPNVEVFVVNEDGKECKSGEEGILVHRGGVVAKGYWNDKVKTEETFKFSPVVPEFLRDKEWVVYSGDIVYKDADGYLYFKDRADDQIKVTGYRVCTDDILDCIYETGLVEICAVFGVKAKEADQKIIACVVPKTEDDDIKVQLLNHLKKELSYYMVPSEVFLLKELPFTQSKKIDVNYLKRLYEENKLEENN